MKDHGTPIGINELPLELRENITIKMMPQRNPLYSGRLYLLNNGSSVYELPSGHPKRIFKVSLGGDIATYNGTLQERFELIAETVGDDIITSKIKSLPGSNSIKETHYFNADPKEVYLNKLVQEAMNNHDLPEKVEMSSLFINHDDITGAELGEIHRCNYFKKFKVSTNLFGNHSAEEISEGVEVLVDFKEPVLKKVTWGLRKMPVPEKRVKGALLYVSTEKNGGPRRLESYYVFS